MLVAELLADLAERTNPGTECDTFYFHRLAGEILLLNREFDAAAARFEKALRLLEQQSQHAAEVPDVMLDLAACCDGLGQEQAAAEWRARAERFDDDLEKIEAEWAVRRTGGAA